MYERHPVIRQVYVAASVLVFAASFMPLYEPKKAGDLYQTMSMWSSIHDYPSVTGVVAIALVLVLALTGGYGAQPRPQGRGAPVAIFVLAVIGVAMLATRAGEGSDPPKIGAGAGLLLGATLTLLVTSALDLWTSLWVEPTPADPPIPPVGEHS